MIALMDAWRTDYDVDPVVLGLILLAGLTLLGLEAPSALRGGRDR